MKKISIEVDEQFAVQLLKNWKQDLADAEAKCQTLRCQIGAVEKQLNTTIVHSKIFVSDDTTSHLSSSDEGGRAKRGENLRLVRDYLRENGAATTGEIATGLNLRMSSVSSVLNNNVEFIRTERGWALKEEHEGPDYERDDEL